MLSECERPWGTLETYTGLHPTASELQGLLLHLPTPELRESWAFSLLLLFSLHSCAFYISWLSTASSRQDALRVCPFPKGYLSQVFHSFSELGHREWQE